MSEANFLSDDELLLQGTLVPFLLKENMITEERYTQFTVTKNE